MSTATGMTFGYARISTTQQDEALQLDALNQAGCTRIYTDTASGATQSRPALDELLEHLRPGDTIVVWRLDRLGRSLRHLVELVAMLEDRNVGLRSLTESIVILRYDRFTLSSPLKVGRMPLPFIGWRPTDDSSFMPFWRIA